MNKWLAVAEIMDALRVIPRLLLIAVYVFVSFYVFNLTSFFFELIVMQEVTDWKLTAYSGFGAITIPAVVGLATGLTKVYMESGRKWKRTETDDV